MIVLALVACFAPATTTSASESGAIDPDDFLDAIAAYEEANPGDFVGAAALANSLGGEYEVSTDVDGVTTPEIASRRYAEGDLPSLQSMVFEDPNQVVIMAVPQNVFSVSISKARISGTTKTHVAGHWNWKDDFVGQGPPVDLATLQFSRKCGSLVEYKAATYKWNNVVTNRASLRNAGLSNFAPVWNIDARPSNFENQADHGYVRVRYDRSGCGTQAVQGAFIYEGNKASSISSVSIGWGFLTVGYSGHQWDIQNSTAAVTL